MAWRGPALVEWLYGHGYGQHHEWLGWLLAAGVLSSLSALLGVSLTAAGVFAPTVLYLASAALCGLWCFLWLEPGRATAAAQAVAASAGVLAAGHGVLLERVLSQERSWAAQAV